MKSQTYGKIKGILEITGIENVSVNPITAEEAALELSFSLALQTLPETLSDCTKVDGR